MVYYFLFYVFTLIKKVTTRISVSGLENIPRGACIIVANHINLLDSPIIGISLRRRVRFMAKEELFDNPVIAFFAHQFGGFPVGKGRLDRRAGKTAIEVLGQGEALVIFPEGKRSPDGRLGTPYGGAALLACKTGAPIVPVGITGTSQLTGKTWYFRRPRVHLNIGQPFTLKCDDATLTKINSQGLSLEVMRHIAKQLPEEYRGVYNTD